MKCISVGGSDNRMDCRSSFHDPINSLPINCKDCGFPDLNHIPEPYYLIKSRTYSSNELALAQNGNFFVRERVKKILELTVPKELNFQPTYFQKSSTLTPWFLAIPVHQVETASVKSSIKRCSSCNQPASAHPGTQFSKWLWDYQSDHHVLKSSTWGSSESGWNQWISVASFMSVQLFNLLKQLKAKGLDEVTCAAATKPDQEDKEWISKQIAGVASEGVAIVAPGTICPADVKWFKAYLKENSSSKANQFDWKSIEKKLKIKFPKSYKDYFEKVGETSFPSQDLKSEDSVQFILPKHLCSDDTSVFDKLNTDDVYYLPFAKTSNGDSFCFAIRKEHKEAEVFVLLHESDQLEAYSKNFVTFMKILSTFD